MEDMDNMDESDRLRNEITAFEADPRMWHSSLPDRCRLIDQFILTPQTPESVQIHFETAKNLYLYAWFVYRFHMVAEQYAFSTIEMALRERLIDAGSITRDEKRLPGLSAMLKIAQSKGLISNVLFVRRNEWVIRMARNRYRHSEMLRMADDGLSELVIDESQVEPTAEELNFDWLDHFIRHIPDQRNMHAHGTTILYPNVLWTFEIVSELINQLFSLLSE